MDASSVSNAPMSSVKARSLMVVSTIVAVSFDCSSHRFSVAVISSNSAANTTLPRPFE
jgi:hypothetical protein